MLSIVQLPSTFARDQYLVRISLLEKCPLVLNFCIIRTFLEHFMACFYRVTLGGAGTYIVTGLYTSRRFRQNISSGWKLT